MTNVKDSFRSKSRFISINSACKNYLQKLTQVENLQKGSSALYNEKANFRIEFNRIHKEFETAKWVSVKLALRSSTDS